jgi:hypothetical protein
LTRDPVPGAPSLPTTLNPYAYGRNNPALYVDPSGKFAFIPLLIVGLAGGALGGLGYYAIQSYMHPNPCTGQMNWDWNQAVLWGTVGMALGGALVAIPYGGWWVSAQLGWWGQTTATTVATAACADGDCTNEARSTAEIIHKISGTGWTAIGNNPAYLDKGRQLVANYLNIHIEEWKQLGSTAAQWARNVEFLDEAIARGDSFRLVTPFAEGWAQKGTFYKAELMYILQKGYELELIHGTEWLIKTN